MSDDVTFFESIGMMISIERVKKSGNTRKKVRKHEILPSLVTRKRSTGSLESDQEHTPAQTYR